MPQDVINKMGWTSRRPHSSSKTCVLLVIEITPSEQKWQYHNKIGQIALPPLAQHQSKDVEMDRISTKQGHTVEGFDPRQLFAHGFALECVDLIQGGSFKEAVGRTIVSLLMGARDQDGKSLFNGVSIILPPATATSLTTDSILQSLVSGTLAMRGSEPDTQELKILRRLVRIVSCATLEVADLAKTMKSEEPRRLIAIAEASKYRDPSIAPPPVFGISAIRTSEDLWVPHVTSLCHACVTTVKGTGGYAIVHVSDTPATRQENVQQLISVDDCFVTCLQYDQDPEVTFNQRVHEWLSMALRGDMLGAAKEIDSLQLTTAVKLQLQAQLFQRAGKNKETLDIIEQMQPHLSTLTPAQLVQLSRLAHKAGDDSRANDLLPEDASRLSEEMWLEEGLEIATYLADNNRIKCFDARLAELYPHSDRLLENRDRRLLLNCREAKLNGSYVFTTAGFTGHHLALLNGLSTPKPNYEQLIAQASKWGSGWIELAMICCAMHARRIGQSRDAADIASLITSSEQYGRQATQIVLSSVRTMMLKEEVKSEDHDYYLAPLQAAIRFLARHPEDSAIRSRLSMLLSVESCGTLGIPLLSLTMLNISSEGVRLALQEKRASKLRPNETDNDAEPLEDEIQEVIARGMMWLSAQNTVEFGVTVLPVALVGPNPDHVVSYLSRLILQCGAQQGEDVDLIFMRSLVVLTCAVSPHATKERNEDLRVMRIFAGQCAIAGQFQQARDLAEQVLLMGQMNEVRRRLAWVTYADIYNRCRNQVEALIGLSCALATDAPVEKADLWEEVYAAIRILRDLGLFELARKFLPQLKELLTDFGFDAATDPRIIATELGLRMMEIQDSELNEIATLVNELARNCEHAINSRNELLPLVVLLGQVLRKADTAGLPVNTQTRELLKKALRQVGVQSSQMVEIVSSITPSAIDVAEMFNKVQRAIYAADTAGDYAALGLVARRLLDIQPEQVPSTNEKAFAVELLADHTITLPDVPPDIEVDWPIRYAQFLNQEGLDVAFLAVDSAGELTVTNVSRGQAQPLEQPRHKHSFHQRMLAWLEDYPRNYGYLDAAHGNNDFFTTIEKLDVRLPTPDSLVVVAEPLLQQLTANLVLVEPENGGFSYFLGTKTAVGMVPSLTWLSRTRSNIRSGKHAYKAWISSDPEGTGVLDVALARLDGTFKDFGFTIDTGRKLPSDMSDAGLAVVTAHGGLTAEGRFIHSIRDEENLVEAPSALALALAGVEVVVLFVCSGGRLDKHPWDNRTVGLPKQLMDKGCRAIIASPWPLDVKVTYRWLEPFLLEWEAGSTILQATKRANEAVARALGDSPQYSLAMTVYGDIMLTR